MKTMKKIILFLSLVTLNLLVYGQNNTNVGGQIVTKTIKIRPFRKLDVRVPSQVILTYGKDYKIKLQGSSKLLPNFTYNNDGNTLELYSVQANSFKKTNLKIEIQVPKIYEIDLNSVVDLRLDDNFDSVAVFTIKSTGVATIHFNGYFSGALEFNLNGVTSLEMNVNRPLQVLNIEESGVSNVVVGGGTVNKLFLKLTGTSSADLSKLKADIVIVETSGMAVAKVYATNIFSAKAGGLSSITFYGNPQVVTMKTSGLANINNGQSD